MTLVVRIGSTISTLIGPIRVSARSSGARPDVNTERCTPSWTTLKAASITPRFGYEPKAMAKNVSSV